VGGTAEFEVELLRLHETLGSVSYYDVLGLRPGCDYVAVREAFHAKAQRYHPDRWVFVSTELQKRQAYEVYKRMTEAYNVLLDPELRAAYDAARVRGETRLSELARARRVAGPEQRVANGFARIYLRSARAKLERDDLRGAWIDVQLGLGIERAEPLEALLAEIERHPRAAHEMLRGQR
jgi:DnaJ-class molecular chaperone